MCISIDFIWLENIKDQRAKIIPLGPINVAGPKGRRGTWVADSYLKFGSEGRVGERGPSVSREDNIHPLHKCVWAENWSAFHKYEIKLVYKYVDEETKMNLCEWKVSPRFFLVTTCNPSCGVSKASEGGWEEQCSKFIPPWSTGNLGKGGENGCQLSLGFSAP